MVLTFARRRHYKSTFNQPYYNQQLFGYGLAYLRGLEYYVTDGVAGILARTTLRRQVLDFALKSPPGSKKQVTIPFKVFLKAGADIGYTYNRDPGNSLLSNKFLYTECVGADIVIVPYDLIFKFEYSFNQLGEQGLFFMCVQIFKYCYGSRQLYLWHLLLRRTLVRSTFLSAKQRFMKLYII